MLGTQQHATTGSRWQQAGFNLGVRFKRAGNWWAGVEKRLVQQAGERGQLVRAGLLVFKVAAAAAAVIAALFAAFWVAIIVGSVVAAIAFGGRERDPELILKQKNGFCADGYYSNGLKVYDYDD